MKKTLLMIGVSVCCCLMALGQTANLNPYAYDLQHSIVGNTYTFSYKLNTTANISAVDLYFYNADDVQVLTKSVPSPFSVTGSVEVAENEFPIGTTIHWSVKVTTDVENTTVNRVTADENELYHFYFPADLQVDNNPMSPHFGNIYLAESTNGQSDGHSETTKTQTEGIYIYKPDLQMVNNPVTSGYAGGISWSNTSGEDRNGPKRMAIDDNGYLFICDYGETAKTGIYMMDPANPTNTFATVLDKSKRGTIYNYVMALDVVGKGSDRVLYIANSPATSMTCCQYNIGNTMPYSQCDKNDVFNATTRAQFVNGDCSIRCDKQQGGWWYAQTTVADKPLLAHVNSAGEIDYNATTALSISSSERGTVNINKDGTLLAVGSAQKAIVYSVQYNAEGVPSLTECYQTSTLGTNIDGLAFDYANNLYVASAFTERMYVFQTPEAAGRALTTPAREEVVPSIAGTYTIGEDKDYPSLAAALYYIEQHAERITGDVILELHQNLTEPVNAGITNTTPYTLTIRSKEGERYTLTYNNPDNQGPSGAMVIGSATINLTNNANNITSTNTPTQHVVLENLCVLGPDAGRRCISIYGDVQDVTIRNCVLRENSTTGQAIGIEIRPVNGGSAHPRNILIDKCIIHTAPLSASGHSNNDALWFNTGQGNGTADSYPENITVRNCYLQGNRHGILAEHIGEGGLTLEHNTIYVANNQDLTTFSLLDIDNNRVIAKNNLLVATNGHFLKGDLQTDQNNIQVSTVAFSDVATSNFDLNGKPRQLRDLRVDALAGITDDMHGKVRNGALVFAGAFEADYPFEDSNTTDDFAGGTIHNRIAFERVFNTNQWETLCLPFEVQYVTVLSEGNEYAIQAHIDNGSANGHYYLYTLPDNTDAASLGASWIANTTHTIPEAKTAYIVRFPDFFEGKSITFYSQTEQTIDYNITVSGLTNDHFCLLGNTTLHSVSRNAYLLDNSGYFVYQEDAEILPSHAALFTTEETAHHMPRIAVEGTVDDLETVSIPMNTHICIYDITGRMVWEGVRADFNTQNHLLPQGVYLMRSTQSTYKFVQP